jgi:DNA-binding protein HU-beta
LNKTELINAIAAEAEISKKDAGKALDAFVEVITKSLQQEEKVQLIGFGTFEVRERAAREGHNPQTGKKIKIAATKVPAFKAGKALKEAIVK